MHSAYGIFHTQPIEPMANVRSVAYQTALLLASHFPTSLFCSGHPALSDSVRGSVEGLRAPRAAFELKPGNLGKGNPFQVVSS